jgi:ricin-type beta-trefoil lectin protein
MKHRFRSAALAIGAIMALSIPLATTAQGATAATTKPLLPATAGSCSYDTDNLGDAYMYPDARTNLDWWAEDGNALSDSGPVTLEGVSSSSNLDCFHIVSDFGNSELTYQLAQSSLCLNIAGNSKSVGAWVIMYDCTYPPNELFNIFPSHVDNGTYVLESVSSGLCVDLSNGWNAGSILVQKACVNDDPWQSWSLST